MSRKRVKGGDSAWESVCVCVWLDIYGIQGCQKYVVLWTVPGVHIKNAGLMWDQKRVWRHFKDNLRYFLARVSLKAYVPERSQLCLWLNGFLKRDEEYTYNIDLLLETFSH